MKIEALIRILSLAASTAQLLGAGPALSEVCVDPNDPACEATIQEGIDAAAPGETVRLAAGVYRESLEISGRDGITLKGAGDEHDESVIESDDPVAIAVLSDDVAIKDLRLRLDGTRGIEGSGTEATVKRVTIEGASTGISGEFSRLEIEDVTVRNGSQGVFVFLPSSGQPGEETEIRGSRFLGLSFGIGLIGGNGTIEENVFERIGDIGVGIEGDESVIRDNSFTAVLNTAMSIEAGSCEVKDNEIDGVDSGISLFCREFAVERNEVRNARGTAILVDCDECGDSVLTENTVEDGGGGLYAVRISAATPGVEARDNTVKDAYATGIYLSGEGIRLTGASVKGCGMEPSPGIDVVGDDMSVEDSLVSDCTGEGFRITGNDNVVRDSEAKKNGASGFQLVSGRGNRLVDNLAKKNAGIGFVVDGDDAVLENNEARENGESICDDGINTSLDGNDFATESLLCRQ